MKIKNLSIAALALVATLVAAGCASESEPTHDDEAAAKKAFTMVEAEKAIGADTHVQRYMQATGNGWCVIRGDGEANYCCSWGSSGGACCQYDGQGLC